MKNALVTGGAGFIGSHVVDMLLQSGFEVVVVDNLSTGSKDNLEGVMDKITFIEADICNPSIYQKYITPETVVIHLAAFVSVPKSIDEPEESHRVNVDGSHTVLLASKKAKMYISASSAAVYGKNQSEILTEESTIEPCSPYGLHKRVNEEYGKLYSELYGVHTTFLRFFNVFGPRQNPEGGYAAVIPTFIQKMVKGESPVIYGNGEQTRDFVFVKDLARIIVQMADSYTVGHNVVNVCTGVSISLNTLWETICTQKNVDITPVYEQARSGDITQSRGDNSKLMHLIQSLNWTPFEEAISETIGYFESKAKL